MRDLRDIPVLATYHVACSYVNANLICETDGIGYVFSSGDAFGRSNLRGKQEASG